MADSCSEMPEDPIGYVIGVATEHSIQDPETGEITVEVMLLPPATPPPGE